MPKQNRSEQNRPKQDRQIQKSRKANSTKPGKTAEDEKGIRGDSRCRLSGKCGGCQFIDIPYDIQISDKQKEIEELIGGFGPVEPMIRMKNPDHYRNKITAVFAPAVFRGPGSRRTRQGTVLPVSGTYRKGTREVLEVRSCLIENTHADRIIQTIRQLVAEFGIPVYDIMTQSGVFRYVQVRMAHRTHQIMVTLVLSTPVFPHAGNFVKRLLEIHPEITTVIHNINTRTDSMVLGEREKVLYGDGRIEDELCGKRFLISSASFYQVNSIQTEKLYNIAIDMAGLSGKESVLDTYCGIGTIGIIASGRAGKVTGVELNADAVRDAAENIRLNGCDNTEVICDDATAFMVRAAKEGLPVDVVIMDPPRMGATPEFLDALIKLSPDKAVYISCNPVTLARDLAILAEGGYSMKKAVPVDMFPYTDSLECACLIVKKN
ncbi:MAG: 23S rRNA (uracil(1939)-C(5))-methyltransferase RlmD [Lachnospiraceae bacterium]|nr:23S rRNA (uracil(1939)-C(5))-methyltransferase RlmD [Lachnospiraceae bacterium]